MKKLMFLISFIFAFAAITIGQNKNEIKYTEYDLSNGLHVILHQDHTTPNVMVALMYHVGAKNEDPTKTGFAHLFEHLMFEGSQNIPRGEYFNMVQSNGGELNANTSQDRTYYYEMMPSNQLELALWMEAERLYHARIDSIGIATQKGVVIEERKQSYDNQPYGSWMEQIGKRAFTVHPYRWQTIGDPEHIINSTNEDVINFYKTYYVPNNAVLVVVGDFEEKQTKEWIDKYYATIPRGTLPMNRPTVEEPAQKQEIRDIVYDKIQLPGVFMAYHAPKMGQEAYAMDILSSILSSGASSRLKTDVTDKGITLQAFTFPYMQEQAGLFYVAGIANMGVSADAVDAALTAEVERMTKELVSEEEFQMAMAAKEFQIASSINSLSYIAEELCSNYTYFKDASRINKELSYYSSVTREDVLKVAQKYLNKNNRVVLYYLPESEKK